MFYKNITTEEIHLYPYQVTEQLGERLLILAPHPDDESIGCGGTLLKHVKQGAKVKVVFITDGQRGDFEGRFLENYVTLRRKSAIKAMEILGIEDYDFWKYEDRGLYKIEKKLSERILNEVNLLRADILLVPSPLEVHPDHKVVFKAAWRIRRRLKAQLVLYEILMAFYPNTLVDITDEIETKKEAIRCYYTETSYNNYVEKVEGLNRFRSFTLPENIRYAEGFISIGRGETPLFKQTNRLIKAFI
jgi:LmbE family N-acetylglucosaminyl deacetylase